MTSRKKGTSKPSKDAQKSAENTGELQETTEKSATIFPIVGIGASAGGLSAFEAFFSGMPKDTDEFGKINAGPGMAFVLVQHLAPDHKSILTELIRRYTSMHVFEVEDGMIVRPNCAYIIPPNRDMAFLNGTLHLMEPASPRGQRLPIDFFFRSLAQDQRERAICIVLSGTGSDGTLGVRAIKGEGGMVMVQTPDTTEYDGMPRSAIATGLVDYELPPSEMAAQLIAYSVHAFGKFSNHAAVQTPMVENAMKKIFILLRSQTGHDFSQYKPGTIHRRIERRLAVHQIGTLDGYVKYLQQTPQEVDSLFRDLLIGVTSFFRDPGSFKVLEEQVIPKLFAGKPADTAVRVWTPGCSSGEEPYSIAILLAEHQEAMKKSFKVQVFATDIDSQAIATARAGLYPASIAADLSPERLARFFTAEPGGSAYRIHKGIRGMLVFSEQDVIKEPPFSKLDLISCRNLLIYMGSDLQKKLIPLFHYALNPDGMLFLGTSETVGEFGDLFAPLDRKEKIYRRREDSHCAQYIALNRFLPPMMALEVAIPRPAKTAFPLKPPLRQLTEAALMEQVASAAVLVNGQGDILYLHGRTGMYLEPVPGEAGINNVLKMAREGLRRELITALHKATLSKEIVRCHGLRVKSNGDFTYVNLAVRPVKPGKTELKGAISEQLYLVILEEVQESEVSKQNTDDRRQMTDIGGPMTSSDAVTIAVLKQELRAKEEYLQSTNEELETSNEEIKSSNEEMQSVNEEWQSTNEELETSLNNDMNNLLAGTGIATVFVDHKLRILRFTPATTKFINLILEDIGRPVGHILSNLLGYDSLVADAQAVLDTLISKDLEVQTADGKWYTMCLRPYRTLENVIEGVVITFMDITEMKLTRESLRKANDLLRLAVVVRDSHDALTVQDLTGSIIAWNPGAVRMYGWSEDEALKMNMRDLIPENLREETLEKLKQLSRSDVLEPYRTQRIAKNGKTVNVMLTATALIDNVGKMYAISTAEREVNGKF
jgi:two-component system CheB/CheR fusion protein